MLVWFCDLLDIVEEERKNWVDLVWKGPLTWDSCNKIKLKNKVFFFFVSQVRSSTGELASHLCSCYVDWFGPESSVRTCCRRRKTRVRHGRYSGWWCEITWGRLYDITLFWMSQGEIIIINRTLLLHESIIF